MEKSILQIRVAEPNDDAKIAHLWLALMQTHEAYSAVFRVVPSGAVAVMQEDFRKKLTQPDCRIFLAENSGILAGMLVAYLRTFPLCMEHQKRGYIAETVVLPAFRNQQIGKQLVKEARKWFVAQEVKYVELQVATQNVAGLRFWETEGFEPLTLHMIADLSKQ